jgi:glucose-1-phosphate adenylyltransferase
MNELADEARGTTPATDYVILSGAAVYHMDVAALVDAHRQRGADITIALHAVPEADAPALGIAKMHAASGEAPPSCEGAALPLPSPRPTRHHARTSGRAPINPWDVGTKPGGPVPRPGRILKFEEKPDPESLPSMRSDPAAPEYLASMGVYVFKREALFK